MKDYGIILLVIASLIILYGGGVAAGVKSYDAGVKSYNGGSATKRHKNHKNKSKKANVKANN